MSVVTSEPKYTNRYPTEQILEVPCPRCGAQANTFCDRSGDKLNQRSRSAVMAGTAPSHTERMWTRQGHDPSDFAALRSKIKPGDFSSTSQDKARDQHPRGPRPSAPPRLSRTRQNLAELGVPWPAPEGWLQALRVTAAADLYRKGISACVIGQIQGLSRAGAEQRIRAAGLGGLRYCPVHRMYESV